MLRWAIIFFVLAIIAGFFGFYDTEGLAAGIGKLLLIIFLILAVVSLLVGRRAPTA